MRMSKPAKSAFWFVLCTLIQKALAFITVPIFTRIMPAEQYGIYNLYQTWSGILVVICTMNMETGAFVNGFTKSSDEIVKDKLPIRLFSMTCLITLVVFGVLVFNISLFEDIYSFTCFNNYINVC